MTNLPARRDPFAIRSMTPFRGSLMLLAVATLAGCAAAPTRAPAGAMVAAPAAVSSAAPVAPATPSGVEPGAMPTKPPASAPGTAPPIAASLFNARYQIDTTASGDAPLKNGLYEETVTGSSGRNVVRLGPEAAYGDLDGDGVVDAAVTLVSTPGGSGAFTYLAAVRDDGGTARPLPSLLLGDRILMKSLAIANGTIRATWLDRAAGEPMSAVPRTEVVKTFVVREGKLEAVGGTPD